MATGTKRALKQAVTDAIAFCDYFGGDTYLKWVIAGSIRREKPEVGDVEHVVIPAFADVPNSGLFGEPERANLLWLRLDELLAEGVVTKHVYGELSNATHRWGDKYRGVDFRGFNHEIFCADVRNWGNTLAIRTGPADYSQMLVSKLHGTRLRQRDGYLKYEHDGAVFPCGDEETFFRMCNVAYVKPEDRR